MAVLTVLLMAACTDTGAVGHRPQPEATPVPIAAADGYDAVILADAPIGYWPLRESAGTTAASAVGGPAGLLEGTVRAGDRPGPVAGTTAFDFGGGACDGVDLDAAAADLHPPDGVSVEAWVSTTDTRASGVVFRARDGGYNLLAGAGGVELTRYPADKTLRVAGSIADGAWHHLVGTYGPDGYRIYVDGRLVGEAAFDGALGYFGAEVAVGRDGHACDGVVPSFRGAIANVTIYSVALSPADVDQHYLAAGRTLVPSGGTTRPPTTTGEPGPTTRGGTGTESAGTQLDRQVALVLCDFISTSMSAPQLVGSPVVGAATTLLTRSYDRACRSDDVSQARPTMQDLVVALTGYIQDKALDATFGSAIEAALRRIGGYSALNKDFVGNLWNKFVLQLIQKLRDRETECRRVTPFPAPQCSVQTLTNSLLRQLV